MYPITQACRQALQNGAAMKAWAMLRAGDTDYRLEGGDILQDTLKVTWQTLPGDSLAPGGVCAAARSITLTNHDGRFNHVRLNYAQIQPFVDVEISPGTYETIPLGVFEVDTVDRAAVTFDRNYESIPLLAADRMVRLDAPFSGVSIGFPCTARQLLTAVCQSCHVPLGVTDFLNADYTIPARPDGDFTCREMVGFIAELACCWAQCDRQGVLVFRWFQNPQCIQEAALDGGGFAGDEADEADGGGFTNWYTDGFDGGALAQVEPDAVITADILSDFGVDDTPITLTGVALETETDTYLVGSPRYAIVSSNPLMQADIQAALSSLHSRLYGFTYLPFHAVSLDDPALEAGDTILLSDIEGASYRTILTDYAYVFDGNCRIEAAGTSEREHNGRTQAQRQFSRLLKTIGQKQKQLNALDDAILNVSQMIAGIWGGHVVNGDTLDEVYHGNIFICDTPDPESARKVWRWNLGGLGYSENGIDGPFTTAITADGSIVASLVTADMIRTGMLGSLNGGFWFDLDNQRFNLSNGSVEFSTNGGITVTSGNNRVVMDSVHGFAVQRYENGWWVTKSWLDDSGLVVCRLSNARNASTYAEIGNVDSGIGMKLSSTGQNGWLSILNLVGGGFRFYTGSMPVMECSPAYSRFGFYNGSGKGAVVCGDWGVSFDLDGSEYGKDGRIPVQNGYLNFKHGVFTGFTSS